MLVVGQRPVFNVLPQAVMESGGARKIVAHTVHNAADTLEASEATS
jgi:hypothetical protein